MAEKTVYAKSRCTRSHRPTRERNLHEILLCWGIFDVLIEMPGLRISDIYIVYIVPYAGLWRCVYK